MYGVRQIFEIFLTFLSRSVWFIILIWVSYFILSISLLKEGVCSQKYCTLYEEAVAWRCSVKKLFLKISQNSKGNTYARISFLIKLLTSACNFTKIETLSQAFSCEFWEIHKNTYFYTIHPAVASVFVKFKNREMLL